MLAVHGSQRQRGVVVSAGYQSFRQVCPAAVTELIEPVAGARGRRRDPAPLSEADH